MRPAILLSFWQVHKCRGHVLRGLEGFVARWRAQGHGASVWEEPMALGFLLTLITRLAQRTAGTLDADALGNLQSELWGRLTGLPPAPLGERLVFLSAGQDPRFVEGCRRAGIFAAALEAERHAAPACLAGEVSEVDPFPPQSDARRDLNDLWDSLLADVPAR